MSAHGCFVSHKHRQALFALPESQDRHTGNGMVRPTVHDANSELIAQRSRGLSVQAHACCISVIFAGGILIAAAIQRSGARRVRPGAVSGSLLRVYVVITGTLDADSWIIGRMRLKTSDKPQNNRFCETAATCRSSVPPRSVSSAAASVSAPPPLAPSPPSSSSPSSSSSSRGGVP